MMTFGRNIQNTLE